MTTVDMYEKDKLQYPIHKIHGKIYSWQWYFNFRDLKNVKSQLTTPGAELKYIPSIPQAKEWSSHKHKCQLHAEYSFDRAQSYKKVIGITASS